MRKKIALLIIVFAIFLALFCACSETDDYINFTYTPTPSFSASPATPTPKPTPDITKMLTITSAKINCNTEAQWSDLSENKLNCHAGNAVIQINVDGTVDQSVAPYIYLNDELINPEYVYADARAIRIFLPDDLPYFFNLEIKSGYESDGKKMVSDYKLEFLHEKALTSEIFYYSAGLSSSRLSAKYLTDKNPTFIIKFSKPVDRDSLELARSIGVYNHSMMWVSDTEVLVSVTNLSNGHHTLDVESVRGISDIYGNKLVLESEFLNFHNFWIVDKQKLYGTRPETNYIKEITELEYGSIFESISKNANYMTMGIVTDDNNPFQYSRAFLDLNLRRLTPFNSFISQSIPDATSDDAVFNDIVEYDSVINKGIWNNEGEYVFWNGSRIYLLNPLSTTAELLYEPDGEEDILYSAYPLTNGNYAAVSIPKNQSDNLLLVILDSEGSRIGDHQLPFKAVFEESVLRYLASVTDPGDGTLIVGGYDGSQQFATYRLNLDDSSVSLITQASSLIGIYPELNYGLYFDYDDSGQDVTMNAIDFNGNLLNNLTVPRPSPNSIVFNPHKNVFYMVEYDFSNRTSLVKILDAQTFVVTDTHLSFENFIEIAGISPSGDLLLMDLVSR